MFRYKIEWWSDIDNKVIHESGFVAADSFTKAAQILEQNCTASNGDCDLISLNIYELDHMNGAITDGDLLGIIEEENRDDIQRSRSSKGD